MSSNHLPVVVVGAGPVGLTAALTLHRRGVPVTVLEAGPGLAAQSRASTFHPPTLELLAGLGVYDELAEVGLVAERFQYRDRRQGLIAEFDLAALTADTPYPFRLQCEQNKLTALQLPHLRSDDANAVHFDWRAVGVSHAGDIAEVHSEDGQSVRARWVIAADGAHSAIRQSLGVAFGGTTYPESFLVVSTTERVEEHFPGLALVNYVFDSQEWAVLLRTPEHWRILLPVPESLAAAGLDRSYVDGRLAALCDLGRSWAIEEWSLYRVHQRVAATLLTGSVVLAGDAAHVNNPLGGMGMNSGLHDAVFLANAIADAFDGGSDEAVTEVAAQRAIVARDFVGRTTHANWERMRNPDEGVRSEIFAGLRRTAADPAATRDALLASSMLSAMPPDWRSLHTMRQRGGRTPSGARAG